MSMNHRSLKSTMDFRINLQRIREILAENPDQDDQVDAIADYFEEVIHKAQPQNLREVPR